MCEVRQIQRQSCHRARKWIDMKTEILTMLRQKDGYLSGQELCDHFGVSRTAIWKAINQLKEAGYEIKAVPNKGYHLEAAPDVMSAEELMSRRTTRWVGEKIVYYDTINSTNTRAKQLAEEGYPSGTLVVADAQTEGRGRRGRSWQSAQADTISMTLMIKPEIAPDNASMLTLVAALAICKAIIQVAELPAQIKWPNDIVVNGRKVVGILTEMSAQVDYINHIVIGVGVNVHNAFFPEELQEMATSLYRESGKRYSRAEIIEAFLEYFEEYYEQFLLTEDLSAIVNEYNRYSVNREQFVRVLDPKEPFEGQAMGINKRGELIVDTWQSRKLVSSGEVSVRGIYGYV